MYISNYSLEDDPPEVIANCIKTFKEKFFGELFNGDALKGKFWIAGGCMRNYFENTEPRDIDIYSVDVNTRNSVHSQLILAGAIQVSDSEMSTVLELDGLAMDLIKKTFSSPEETLWSFDLSPALCATDGESLYFEEHYFLNLADRSLIVFNPKGSNTIDRVIRYSQQGFSMSKAQVIKLCEELGVEDTLTITKDKVQEPQSQLSAPTNKQKLTFKKIWPKKKPAPSSFVPSIFPSQPQTLPLWGPGGQTVTFPATQGQNWNTVSTSSSLGVGVVSASTQPATISISDQVTSVMDSSGNVWKKEPKDVPF